MIGPLIDMKAVEKVKAHIADALKKGAKVVTGGKRAAQGGSFFEPTVLTNVTTDMVITKEESFGPVAPLYRFKSEEDAITSSSIAAEPGNCQARFGPAAAYRQSRRRAAAACLLWTAPLRSCYRAVNGTPFACCSRR